MPAVVSPEPLPGPALPGPASHSSSRIPVALPVPHLLSNLGLGAAWVLHGAVG